MKYEVPEILIYILHDEDVVVTSPPSSTLVDGGSSLDGDNWSGLF